MFKSPLTACVLAVLLAASPLSARQPDTKTPGVPGDRRVLIISIDGMRPDVLLRADAPNIREILKHGSFTFWAESTDLAITLPTHVSMLTGVSPGKHRITWNDNRAVKAESLAVATLFDLTKRAGYTNAMIVGKQKLCLLARPGIVDCIAAPVNVDADALAIAERAADLLRTERPRVMFVHFPDPDTSGHASGWGSPDQVATAGRVDHAIGMLMKALRDLGLTDRTLILITADHGGSGRSHGAKVPFSRYIPWIAAGPGVRENHDLTSEAAVSVRVEDVFATSLNFLGITIPDGIDGKPVRSIYGRSGKHPQ